MQRGGATSELALKEIIYDQHTKDHGILNGLKIRKLNMEISHKDSINKFQKVTLGNPSPHKQTKVILLVGATGAGKTTLINAMVNYIFGINFKDDFRFILIDDDDASKKSQTESQTDLITAYAFNHMDGMPFGYNYVLIDTPGFGDTRGIERDQQLMNQLEKFLKQSSIGIDKVHCVGFVVSAMDSRLTQTQSYVLNGVSSMFGKDIGDNIYIMATFADSNDPPVLDALKAIGVQYNDFYTFNYGTGKVSSESNSDSDDEDDTRALAQIYWKKGYKSMDKLFNKLSNTIPASLFQTQNVLEWRQKLQSLLDGIKTEINVGLDKLVILHQRRKLMAVVNSEVDKYSNYEEEVDVPKNEETYTTRGNKTSFGANIKKGDIGIAFQKESFSTEHRITKPATKEKRINQETYDCYKSAVEDSKFIQDDVKEIEKDIKLLGQHLLDKINEMKQHVEKLEKIALKTNPQTTEEYIDVMIESEKSQKTQNFQQRIHMLELLKSEKIDFTTIGAEI